MGYVYVEFLSFRLFVKSNNRLSPTYSELNIKYSNGRHHHHQHWFHLTILVHTIGAYLIPFHSISAFLILQHFPWRLNCREQKAVLEVRKVLKIFNSIKINCTFLIISYIFTYFISQLADHWHQLKQEFWLVEYVHIIITGFICSVPWIKNKEKNTSDFLPAYYNTK